MVDPTGLSGAVIGFVVGRLLLQVIEQTKNAINFRRYCQVLHDLLQNIEPLVSAATSSRPRESYTDTNGTVVAGPSTVKKWLKDLESVLKEAQALVKECSTTSYYSPLSRVRMSRKILNITKRIETISTVQAPFAALNIMEEIIQKVLASNRLLTDVMAQLQLDLSARAVGGTTQAILQIEGIQPVQAFLEIKSRTDNHATGLYRDSGAISGSQQNDQEGERSLYTLRQVPEKTFGMDVPLAKLQELLLGKITNMKWVGVYGKGGIGKTLLVEHAYNSEVVQNHFQNSCFWLTVGKRPSIERLLKKLCDMLDITKSMEIEDAKSNLFNKLRGKKVLLVLDDVWEDDGHLVLDWLDVTSGWDTGSKILVTTRNIEVLGRKHAEDISTVRMERLSDGDSWELFCEFAFGGVHKIPKALDKLGRAVANECKGLPLALKVIAGAQAGQRSTEQWQRALKKLKEAETLNPDHEVQLYNRLQLSYDSLEFLEAGHRYRLQKCFIYFAAFREDSDVDMEKLVNLWAGEKLIEANDETDNDMDPSLDGNYLLGILIGRSLIDLQKASWSNSVNSYKLQCRVHDVLRDLARHLIRQGRAPIDCLFSAGEGLKKFPDKWLTPIRPSILGLRSPGPSLTSNPTHLSLNDNLLESLPSKLEAPRLEVLLLANNGTKILAKRLATPPLVIPPGFLESFASLKVLDLEHSIIDSLPESLENLRNLMFLELSYTGLCKLPRGLRKLTKLENLGLQGCGQLQPWPFDISRLRSLTFLNTRGSAGVWGSNRGSRGYRHTFSNTPDSLESLCSLTALQSLSIGGDRDHLPSKMSSLINLRHLSLYFPGYLKKLPLELRNSTGPQLSKLQHFSLDNCWALSELPSWIDSLSQLATLNLVSCRKLRSLPNLHKLQELQKLDLSVCTGLQELPAGFASSGAFPALKELYMANCEGLQEFPPIEEGAFPQLMILELTGCAFQSLPSSLSLLPELQKLKLNLCRRLKNLDNCFSLRERGNNDSGSQHHDTKPYFTNLQELGLKELPLDNLPPDLAACPALKTIDLRSCDVIIPENLQKLTVEGRLTILMTAP